MKKGSAKRVSSLPSNAEFNLGGLYHALRIATVRSSDSLWVPFDKEGKCCKVIHSPTQPQYVETICCLLYTNDELMLPLYVLQSYPFYSRPQFMIPFMFIISTYRNKVNTNGLEFMKI